MLLNSNQPSQIEQFKDINFPTTHFYPHQFIRQLLLAIHDIQNSDLHKLHSCSPSNEQTAGSNLLFLQTELRQVTHFADTHWEGIK